MEADTHTLRSNENYIIMASGETGLNEGVARDNLNSNDTATADVGKIAKRSLFDRAGAGGEEDTPFLLPGDLLFYRHIQPPRG